MIVAFAAADWQSPAGAQPDEVCVSCTGPTQSYRCVLTGPQAPDDLRIAGFYCAARIAEQDAHRICAALRSHDQCDGALRSFVYDADAGLPGAVGPDVAARGDEAGQYGAGQDAPSSQREQRDGPPETMVELTRETREELKRAARETAKTTRNVGERVRDAAAGAAGAVDRAARRTWKCIGTLFDEC